MKTRMDTVFVLVLVLVATLGVFLVTGAYLDNSRLRLDESWRALRADGEVVLLEGVDCEVITGRSGPALVLGCRHSPGAAWDLYLQVIEAEQLE